MNRADPFSGFKLSEAAKPKAIDQRLFQTPRPSRVASAPTEGRQTTADVPPVASAESPANQAKPQTVHLSSLNRTFDLSEEPLYKASYLLTQQEHEALDDLKLELGRELDMKITKNDLMRCALHMLAEDYAATGSRSFVRRKVAKWRP